MSVSLGMHVRMILLLLHGASLSKSKSLCVVVWAVGDDDVPQNVT